MKFVSQRSLYFLSALAVSSLATSAAQNAYPEVEPNGPKNEATAVQCLHDGDTLTGTTTGTSIQATNGALPTADTFRLETCPLPLGIYRHRLVITSATPGQVGTLRGHNQTGMPGTGGLIGGLDVEVQRSSPKAGLTTFNQWYGFGKGEEMYYRIEGTSSTTAPYAVVMNTTPVMTSEVEGAFYEGNITISTVGLRLTTDTDLWVYNDSFAPLYGGGNDDVLTRSAQQSRLVRNLTPGTYYLAIADSNLANDQASPVDDGDPTKNVLDFPDAVANSQISTNVNVSFAISDVYGHAVTTQAMKVGVYDIQFFRFVVLPHPYSSHTFCAGDGHPGSQLCPCGNNGAPDHGCAGYPNFNGAYLDLIGLPSVVLDDVVLRAGDLPQNTVCLFFQGSALANAGFGSIFQDGILCASGSVRRLGVKQVDPFGEAVFGFQQPGDPLVHTAGGITAAGGAFTYQVWYRNVQGPCGSRSNTTNGLVINWGH